MTHAVPQHLDALAKANRIRFGRATLKRAISSGERPLAPVILGDVDHELITIEQLDGETATIGELTRRVPIVDLLSWQHRWGSSRARRVLWLLSIPESRYGTLTLSALSPVRRKALADLVTSPETVEVAA